MSQTIQVQFTGICTHVLSGLGAKPRHRVLLVRADNGAYVLHKGVHRRIPPHVPKLRIKPNDIAEPYGELPGLEELDYGLWRMHGVGLELEGLTAEPCKTAYDPEVPRLRSASGALGQENTNITVHEQAACYFDVYDGQFTSRKLEHGAIITELTAKLSGTPKLRITRFWDRETSTITLVPGATIHIEHAGSAAGDTEYDFLLHYLIFNSIPDDVDVPDEQKLSLRRENRNDLSAGCSNSQYP
jgi:hypothetical protein